MNRFWGRNEGYSNSPRFSRDDEQLLALNYENLCDGDYLNRLFVTDNLNGSGAIAGVGVGVSDKDNSSQLENSISSIYHLESSSNQPDSILYASDVAEDLILFGNEPDLGKSLFEKRFHNELSSQILSKNQDSVTNVIYRQAVVFEHIGKLMLERCKMNSKNKGSDLRSRSDKDKDKDNNSSSQGNDSNSNYPRSIVSEVLSCTLKVIESKSPSSLKRSSLEALLSIMFQIVEVINVS